MSIEKLAGAIASILTTGFKPPELMQVGESDRYHEHGIVLNDHSVTFHPVPESVRKNPIKVQQRIQIHTVADFIAYVNRYVGNERHRAIIAVSPSLTKLVESGAGGVQVAVAVVDYHEGVAEVSSPRPGWKAHQAVFKATAHPRYVQVVQHDAKYMPQAEFVQWLELVSRYCIDHEPAALLDLVQNLRLTLQTDVSSVVNQRDGSCDLVYKVEVTAHGGSRDKPVNVPQQIAFRVPMLQGGQSVDLTATLRYRNRDGKVEFAAVFTDRQIQELEALEALADQIANQTGVQTLIAAPSSVE